MSIKESLEEIKPQRQLPNEEEFDIVSLGGATLKGTSYRNHAFFALVIGLIALISFGIGKLMTYRKSEAPIGVVQSAQVTSTVESTSNPQKSVKPETTATTVTPKTVSVPKTQKTSAPVKSSKPALVGTVPSGPIVASKNGTKYYLATCSGAKRISDENKIYFATSSEAQKVGLTPSSSCKGLK